MKLFFSLSGDIFLDWSELRGWFLLTWPPTPPWSIFWSWIVFWAVSSIFLLSFICLRRSWLSLFFIWCNFYSIAWFTWFVFRALKTGRVYIEADMYSWSFARLFFWAAMAFLECLPDFLESYELVEPLLSRWCWSYEGLPVLLYELIFYYFSFFISVTYPCLCYFLTTFPYLSVCYKFTVAILGPAVFKFLFLELPACFT